MDTTTTRRLSLFSHQLDRIAFVAYFLGAVVPLGALAVVAHRHGLLAGGSWAPAWLGVVVGMAVLSLGAFFLLRRTTRTALSRMEEDNQRLDALLNASSALGGAADATAAAAIVTRHALKATGAQGCWLLLDEREDAPRIVECSGSISLMPADDLAELVRTAGADGRPFLTGDREGRWTAAVAPLRGERESTGALVVATEDRRRFEAAQLDALSTLAGLATVALMAADLRHAQRNFFAHVVDILSLALDAHLGYNAGHGTRVARLANMIGHHVGLDEAALHDLHFAALLHDIGMLKLPAGLSGADECQEHPVLGHEMLAAIRIWEASAPIVLHHHEWYDGSGYPAGRRGEEIPLTSRILSVCDAFDALTSETSYKEAVSFDEAVAEIEAGAGTQFDPEVVAAFRTLVGEGVIEPATADDLALTLA